MLGLGVVAALLATLQPTATAFQAASRPGSTILAGAAAALDPSHHTARHSLNFGSDTKRKNVGSLLSQDDGGGENTLIAFNNAQASLSADLINTDDREARGLALARSFVEHIHPAQDFHLQSHSRSNDVSLVHAYFVQRVHGRDVVDGLINVNVDVNSGKVVSYGDSAFVPHSAEACGSDVATRAGDYAYRGISQLFFGSSKKANRVSSDSSTQSCPYSASETVNGNEAVIDPRIAVANFILAADPDAVSAFANLDELVESMHVSHSFHSTGDETADGKESPVTIYNVPGAVSERGVPAKLAYIQNEDALSVVWSIEYESNHNWYEAHISAEAQASQVAQPLLVVDWQRDAPAARSSSPSPPTKDPEVQDYMYRVYKWGINDPTEGKRTLERNPADRAASPFGWHEVPKGAGVDSGKKGSEAVSSDKAANRDDETLYAPGWSSNLRQGATFKDTRGNNVFAQDNPSGGTSFETNYRPQGERNVFDYKLGWGKKDHREGHQVEPRSYINVSITELFYTCNEIHDLFYEYGFNEVSGNFQEHNNGRGGRGGDAVVAMAQDGSGMNNANFATPPDGNRPRMRMYVWSGTPYTDGDLEAGIVIHEYAHGISTRLTGGPANSGCLGFGEAGGMGEGYGDFLATIIRMQDETVRDYSMGQWAAHRDGGIRKYPYSTNMTINPVTYKTLDTPGYWGVHDIGFVYATMLFEVVEDLIEKHGFSKSLFPPAVNSTSSAGDHAFYASSDKTGRKYPKHGNTYAVQLLIDSFKLQPCRPSIFDNRDAIIQADHVYTGGENECLIWKAFAKRGLGPDASLRGATPWGGGIRTNDFAIPKKCIGKH